ncbi:hypothetical protein ACTXMZ_15635, partial [Brachybacterium alimentarium]|uniref:hypothetical protein n=1 Tax=Brachybacterium alimentarium TaxID=47845 RepID=UPI003FD044CC
ITDEMADRFIAAYMAESGPLPGAIRAGLVAMHASPPSRPDGAEELEAVIGLNAGAWTNGADDVRELASLLASEGVRVVTEEER